jgi:O-acetyl-ADP-ribose deacetylase (regulator of RNase III)
VLKNFQIETMEMRIGNSKLELTKGNIVEQTTGAIVNAANSALAPGGGVAGAIHATAGPGLWEECKTLGGCPTGEARITSGHELKVRYVIHTVGPIYSGKPEDEELLRSCYVNSLELAVENKIKSVSFPAISAGIFGYPMEEAARVSLTVAIEFLKQHPELDLIRFVLFNQSDYDTYADVLRSLDT